MKADDIIKINCASYRDNLNAWIDYSSKINMEAFHKYFCGMLRPAARILDAGCGTGRDSLALQERGFRVDAFDASEEMVELAKSIGINARVGNLQSLSARNRYDGIWACASLIHVPRIQLNDVIKRLVRALIKHKKLVGGGVIKIVNNTVPQALIKLGYTPEQAEQIVSHIDSTGTIEGAPHLKPEHLAVFDCSFRPQNGTRSIHYMGHVRMMAAVQPFISGAISKTINMPEESTAEDIMNAYIESWKLGLKAVAIYRDNSKRVQPLSSVGGKGEKKPPPPRRRRRSRGERWSTGPCGASCPMSAAPSRTSSRSAATKATSPSACTTMERRAKSSSPWRRKAPPFPA